MKFSRAAVGGILKAVLHKTVPGQLVIQFSNACNATCPQCGLRVTERFKRSKIPLDTMKGIIDAAAEKNMYALSFTGGEPFLYRDDLISLIRHAGNAGIECIRTGTNGFMFTGSEKEGWEKSIHELAASLAGTKLYTFWISIDSAVPAVHESMRGLPGVIAGIEKALPIFHGYGIYPAANLGINRNIGGDWAEHAKYSRDREEFRTYFRESFRLFFRRVIDMGFTTANACYPMSVDESSDSLESVYGASSPDDIVSFTAKEKADLFGAMSEAIPEFRPQIRIFTPRASLHALERYHEDGIHIGYPCPGGKSFYFIDAESADTYPCGFLGAENLGPFPNLDVASRSREEHSCRLCEWECFRDPADIIGPVMDFRKNPFALLKRTRRNPEFYRLWYDDVRYQRACGFFNGRKAPDLKAMRRFK